MKLEIGLRFFHLGEIDYDGNPRVCKIKRVTATHVYCTKGGQSFAIEDARRYIRWVIHPITHDMILFTDWLALENIDSPATPLIQRLLE